MSDIISAICHDMDAYEALCARFEERIIYSNGSADCYGVHAKKLKERARREDEATRRGGSAESLENHVEVEVKLPVDEKTLCWLEKKLNRVGRGTPWVFQQNVIYRTDKGFVRFRKEEGCAKLTIKGKNSGGRYNQRTEIESDIDVKLFESVLKSAEQDGAIVYSKRRATYFEDRCTICLDDLGGKYFVEIEGERANIDKNIARLGLEGIPTEKKDYAQIVGDMHGKR
jgi:adenylate cyclase class IV